MAHVIYDLVIVGGGLGGASLATAMAAHGARVLVIERETRFKDRVRGEGLHAWGVPEARALGVLERLRTACAVETRWLDLHLGATPLGRRDFVASTPHASPLMGFSHPRMQEALIGLAAASGAEVWRGAAVRGLDCAQGLPRVTVEREGWMQDVRARLVVGADGRHSPCRDWGGFSVVRDPARRMFVGVLLENVPLPGDTWYAVLNPENGQEVFLVGIGDDRVRAYLGYENGTHAAFGKARDLPRFVAASVATGADPAFYAHARVAGPMAGFAAEDHWVEHPYRNGIALIGDAASCCDPSFGQGMAMTLRGARLLRDALLADDDWSRAGAAYATTQHHDFMTVRTLEHWLREMFLDTGPAADARRARALPACAAEPDRVPDLFGLGPAARADEYARRRFFALDA